MDKELQQIIKCPACGSGTYSAVHISFGVQDVLHCCECNFVEPAKKCPMGVCN